MNLEISQKEEEAILVEIPENMHKIMHNFYTEIQADEAEAQLWEMFDYAFVGMQKEGVPPKTNLAYSYKLVSSFIKELEVEYRKFEKEKDQKK
jgi:hypothetical protein